jgi:hypothetical protein
MSRRLAVMLLSPLLVLIPTQGSNAHVSSDGTNLRARVRPPGGIVERGDRVLVIGRLRSSEIGCRLTEVVELKRRSRVLDTDQTDPEGRFRLGFRPRRSQKVFVTFQGSVETSYGHFHECRPSVSERLRITVTTEAPRRCDPAYPGVCIRPPPPDLDCDDIIHRDFRVKPADPHGFDPDNDGIGCETPNRVERSPVVR